MGKRKKKINRLTNKLDYFKDSFRFTDSDLMFFSSVFVRPGSSVLSSERVMGLMDI